MSKKDSSNKISKSLRGHIIKGIERAEDGDYPYFGYVINDDGENLDIIDRDSLDDFFNNSGDIRTFHPERESIIEDHGPYFIDIKGLMKELDKKLKRLEQKKK